jgi:hypothetical protein
MSDPSTITNLCKLDLPTLYRSSKQGKSLLLALKPFYSEPQEGLAWELACLMFFSFATLSYIHNART